MGEERPKRRLTVLQNAPEPSDEERPGWHFIVITALTMLFSWILLAWIVNGLLGGRVRAGQGDLWVTLANVAVFFTSGALSGALAGRYGAAASRRDACVGGSVAALLGWSVPFAWIVFYGVLGRAALSWILLLAAMIGVALASTALGFTVLRRRGVVVPPA